MELETYKKKTKWEINATETKFPSFFFAKALYTFIALLLLLLLLFHFITSHFSCVSFVVVVCMFVTNITKK